MDVLGINAFHADAAAALLREGELLAGIEEERLNRVKHWSGFPGRAIGTVLEVGGTALDGVEAVAISRDPRRRLGRRLLFALRRVASGGPGARLRNLRQVAGVGGRLRGLGGQRPFRGRVHHVEHHRAHLASAFYCSPFDEAACLTVDGFGDFVSSMSAVGTGHRLRVLDAVPFPHSLGILYTAVTQYLGFHSYGDEYKVMALASFGRPRQLDALARVVRLTADGGFRTDPDFFRHATEGVTMSWEDARPEIGPLWSRRLEEALGPARAPGSELDERHHDVAASLQAVYEQAFFHRLRWLQRRTGLRRLCLAGGCALNSVANGKVRAETGFEEVFVQPAAGDAGTALGAAQYVWHQVMGRPRRFRMEHAYWGPEFPEGRLEGALRGRLADLGGGPGGGGRVRMRRAASEDELFRHTAAALARGRIVGWYQGRSEWGPRALGNRSILADPRRAEMKDELNARIKRRESFRPFAPSVLEERAADYFDGCAHDPFMVTVLPIRPRRLREIPAVAHVDGTGRLQTVSRAQNPRYWGLLKSFEEQTRVPVLLNTSFNENEPIVNTPEEAVECFLRAGMDQLVLGDWIVERAEEVRPPPLTPCGASGR
jgi:carbamoyltransferase